MLAWLAVNKRPLVALIIQIIDSDEYISNRPEQKEAKKIEKTFRKSSLYLDTLQIAKSLMEKLGFRDIQDTVDYLDKSSALDVEVKVRELVNS